MLITLGSLHTLFGSVYPHEFERMMALCAPALLTSTYLRLVYIVLKCLDCHFNHWYFYSELKSRP
jgi:hypothetical protein